MATHFKVVLFFFPFFLSTFKVNQMRGDDVEPAVKHAPSFKPKKCRREMNGRTLS